VLTQALTLVATSSDPDAMHLTGPTRAAGRFCGAWGMMVAGIAGCSGNGAGLDVNGRPVEGGDAPLTAQFESIQRNVFTPVCTACHAGAAAPLGLRLEEGAAYAMLVNVPSVEVPQRARVAPGAPDASYLVHKLEGTAAVGSRMPLNGPPLDAQTIQVIRQWILEGAQPPVSVRSNKSRMPAPTLSALWPIPDARLVEAPKAILLAADAELDTTLLRAGTVRLTYGTSAESNPEPLDVTIEAPTLAPTTIAIKPLVAWRAGEYELRISGSAPLSLADLAARPIDGDGDGVAGGDYVLRFSLEHDE